MVVGVLDARRGIEFKSVIISDSVTHHHGQFLL
jgi:hypothetical protein